MTAPTPDTTSDDFLNPPSGRAALSTMFGGWSSFLLNIVLPFVGFLVLDHEHVGTVTALTIVAIFPLAAILYGWVRTHHTDALSMVSLLFIVVGIATSFITGSARFLLIKESVFTALFGLVYLGSLLRERPLGFYFGRQFVAHGDPARTARWDDLWQYLHFRHSQRVITAVWGIGWILDAAIRVVLVFMLSVTVFMVVSQVMFFGVFIGLFMWTMAYARRKKREGDAARAQGEGEGVGGLTHTPGSPVDPAPDPIQ